MSTLCFSAGSTEQVQEQRRQDAATVFRQRRHISQDDTLSMAQAHSFEDLGNSLPRVERPSNITITVSMHTIRIQ
jgi:hypothetical protein